MNVRARVLATLLAGLGTAVPVFGDEGWVPHRRTPPAGDVRQAGHEVTGPPAVLPPVTVELPEVPKIPGAPDQLPAPGDVADPPPAPPPPEIPPAAPMPRVITIPPAPPVAQPAPPEFDSGPGGWWAEIAYLQWWYRGAPLPPLVTAGAVTDPAAGALGQPGTRVLYGGGSTGTEWANGVRVRVGSAIACSPYGWEVGGFYTQPQATGMAFASRDFPVLARPFYDTLAGTPASFVFGLAGLVDGVVAVRTRTTLWGLEANATTMMSDAGTAFVGVRHLELTDEMRVLTQDTVGAIGSFITGTFLPAGSFEAQGDRFTARNQFTGAQVGYRYQHGWGRIGLDARASLAVGVTSERVTVEGGTQTFDPLGVPRGAPAGFLALPSNTGQFDRDRFTAVPELGLRVTYQVKPGVQLFAGYDVLYWSRVARAGDQVDIGQDPRQNPSSFNFATGRYDRPALLLRDTDFWAHGLSFGVRVEY
jgi:hypothetical protein